MVKKSQTRDERKSAFKKGKLCFYFNKISQSFLQNKFIPGKHSNSKLVYTQSWFVTWAKLYNYVHNCCNCPSNNIHYKSGVCECREYGGAIRCDGLGIDSAEDTPINDNKQPDPRGWRSGSRRDNVLGVVEKYRWNYSFSDLIKEYFRSTLYRGRKDWETHR